MKVIAGRSRQLWLAADPALVRGQLTGELLSSRTLLLDDISTDEISPSPAMLHPDSKLGRNARAGFTAGGQRPIGRDALRDAGLFTSTDFSLLDRHRFPVSGRETST